MQLIHINNFVLVRGTFSDFEIHVHTVSPRYCGIRFTGIFDYNGKNLLVTNLHSTNLLDRMAYSHFGTGNHYRQQMCISTLHKI
jgi:hypothetical protein